MATPSRVAKAGTLLCVDRGEYSDYQVIGFFVVLCDFDPMIELDEFMTQHPDQREYCEFEADQFLATLLAKGLLLEIAYGSLYMGCYRDHSKVRFTPGAE